MNTAARSQSSFRQIESPGPEILGENYLQFVRNLGGPAWLTVPGRDRSRRRVIVTLLHGNEPSGVKATHALLSQGVQPETDLAIAIVAVDAALYEPPFSHRYIPGEKDLNRCFPPGDDAQHRLTAALLDLIADYQPEAVVDTHNTSSHSDPFGITVNMHPAAVSLAAHFVDILIVLDQHLGTLLEYLDPALPALTVEFGGFMDPGADALARRTLQNFVMTPDLRAQVENPGLKLLEHPFRLETVSHLEVVYRSTVDTQADLTIINTIDQMNFREIPAGTTLGWFRQARHRNLFAHDASGRDRYLEFFSQEDGLLRNRVPMTLFMATTDPLVANTDCLLYFSPVR